LSRLNNEPDLSLALEICPLYRVLFCLLTLTIAACARSEPPQLESRLGGDNAYTYKGGRNDPSRSLNRHAVGSLAAANDFKKNAGDIVYFSSDSSDVTPEGQQTLAAQARWLQGSPSQPVTVEGHADERGTREYNIALGAKRAASVRNALVSLGVAANRIRTVSYGKERPVATCDDISCWSRNRRAQTTLGATAISQN
jgi:peptidoglycan-associated lipoprotein